MTDLPLYDRVFRIFVTKVNAITNKRIEDKWYFGVAGKDFTHDPAEARRVFAERYETGRPGIMRSPETCAVAYAEGNFFCVARLCVEEDPDDVEVPVRTRVMSRLTEVFERNPQ